jgi:hypothetical protein
MKLAVRTTLLLLVFAAPAFAHHGKDFLLVESYELPHPKALYAVSAEELMFGRGAAAFRDEPSLLFGLTDRVAAEVHAHLEKSPGENLNLEAIAPAIHIRLLDSSAFHVGLSAEYEIARPGNGNAAALRLIFGRSIGEGAIVGNIGLDRAEGERTRAFYAIGYRPDMEGTTSWGIEAQGALRHGEQHEAIVAGYHQISERLTLKGGAGVAVGAGKPLALIRTGVVWRF